MTCARRPAGARKPASPSESPRRPDPRPGRRCARLSLLLPALALLLGALSPFAAAPAAADVLVSNIGQTAGLDSNWRFTIARAQGFTTGSNADGYTLESIEARIRTYTALTTGQRNNVKAQLWSAFDSGTNIGKPNEKIADLTVPSTLGSAAGTVNVAFAAPSGTTLAADTTYFLYFPFFSAGSSLSLVTTTSGNEDSGAATGWSVGNSSYYGNPARTLLSGESYRIRVNGSAAQSGSSDPPAAPTGLNVSAGDTKLDLSWTAPSGTVTGYDVHYTSADSGTVANDAAVTTGAASAGWVDASHSGTAASHRISSLTNGTPYRVRVRAVNANGNSDWVVDTGMPAAACTLATGEIWCATLTPQAFTSGSGGVGCVTQAQCNSLLSDNEFTVGGTTYSFTVVADFNPPASNPLQAAFTPIPANTALRALKFCVGTTEYSIGGAAIIGSSDPGWSAGTSVRLSDRHAHPRHAAHRLEIRHRGFDRIGRLEQHPVADRRLFAEQREGGVAPGFVRPARIDVDARGRAQPQRRQRDHDREADLPAPRGHSPPPGTGTPPSVRPRASTAASAASTSCVRSGAPAATARAGRRTTRCVSATRPSAASSAPPQARASSAVRPSAAARVVQAAVISPRRTDAMRGASGAASRTVAAATAAATPPESSTAQASRRSSLMPRSPPAARSSSHGRGCPGA